MQRSCADVSPPYKRKCWTNSGGPVVNSLLWGFMKAGYLLLQLQKFDLCLHLHGLGLVSGHLGEIQLNLCEKKAYLFISNKLEYQCGSGVETSVPYPYQTFWDGDGSLAPYTALRIRLRIRLRILLFSSVVFKKQKSFITVGTVHLQYISLQR
jgi:hypothetical protein